MNAYDELPDAVRRLLVDYDGLAIADRCSRAQQQMTELQAELDRLAAARDTEAVLRHCVYPGCLRECDLNGRAARPAWSVDGWRQMNFLSAYICPEHAPLVQGDGGPGPHRPDWQRGQETLLGCACGWASPVVRWRGFGIESWKDHLLTIAEQP